MTLTVPQPAGKLPYIGHTRLINFNSPIRSFMKIAAQTGPIFSLEFARGSTVVVSSQELVNEVCDESRFDKKVSGALRNIRDIALDGLFTAHTTEPNWQKAHNILMPGFGMGAMADYFPMMLEIAQELIGKWDRLNPSDEINVPDDMVRLTLDTIGLCGFDYRFHSFSRETLHPFIQSMLVALQEAGDRSLRLPLLTTLNRSRQRHYESSAEHLKAVVDQVIRERRESGQDESGKRDLLSLMLTAVDPATGERLSDENIRYQIITFLIAGHETTSGLLSFTLYALLKNPTLLSRACAEVDEVLGEDPDKSPTLAEIGRLRYLKQILNESLRLWPPAPAFTVMPLEDTEIGGGYPVRRRGAIIVLVPQLHRDPKVWGDNPELFDPDNFSPEKEARRPPNAFKPFGNGRRACIGSQFAMQEATLALAMMLQRFRFVDHTDYRLRIRETLTLKPEDFRIRIRKRSDAERTRRRAEAADAERSTAPTVAAFSDHATPLLVLYGSNMGSAEQVANRIAEEGESQGYTPAVAPLDSHVGRLPKEGLVAMVSASYNGSPPDNARAFVDWLEQDEPDLSGVRYLVFGVGNRDWSTTYQRVPRLLDERCAALGARRLCRRGEADARADFFGDVDSWMGSLWSKLAVELGLSASEAAPTVQGPRYSIESVAESAPRELLASHYDLEPMSVVANRELADTSVAYGRSKRHITFELGEGREYKTGDHLLVMPESPKAIVTRALERLALEPDQLLVLRRNYGSAEHLPLERPVRSDHLLTHFVELQEPATRRQIELLAARATCPPEASALLDLASTETYAREVLEPRRSLIDLCCRFPSVELSLAELLEHLPASRPRYYSIASSHYQQPRSVDLLVSVVNAPSRTGNGRYQGACSTYLDSLRPGEVALARVRDVTSDFLPPEDLGSDYLMIGAGSGLAPFRGFVQDRLHHHAQGESLGRALLFFGCRHRDVDFLFREELEHAAGMGVLELSVAFSRDPEHGVRYVQDALIKERRTVWELLEGGAIVYVCGDGRGMLPGVRSALEEVHRRATGSTPETSAEWLATLEKERRFRVDAWF